MMNINIYKMIFNQVRVLTIDNGAKVSVPFLFVSYRASSYVTKASLVMLSGKEIGLVILYFIVQVRKKGGGGGG